MKAAVIDPSEAGPVLDAVKKSGATLESIWNTHHHPDHVGGNKKLVEHFPNLGVYGSEKDKGKIPCQTHFLKDSDVIEVGGMSARVISNPGHTHGAISYYAGNQVLFTGDTLFGAGCGRLFEGSPKDMQESFDKLFSLPKNTQVYCGHEYTGANLKFASAVEPNNLDIAQRQKSTLGSTHKVNCSVPFLLGDEKKTNPFARTDQPDVIKAVSNHFNSTFNSPDEVFGALRKWKDGF